MGDDDDGDAQLFVDIRQQGQHGLRRKRVQRTGGLITQQHLGLCGQRAGDGHALLLPAGKLGRVRARAVLQADNGQKLRHPGLHRRLVVSLLQPEGEGNVFGHGLLHQQIVALEHHAHAPARRAQLRAGKGSDVLPGEHDLPGGGALQQRQTAQQRGFSRARHADDAVDVSFSDLQVHILQRRHARALPLKDLRQMRYRDQNRFSFSFPLCTALRRSKQKARPRNLRSKDGQKCSRYHLVSLFPHGKSLSRCARG